MNTGGAVVESWASDPKDIDLPPVCALKFIKF
jgi:hypothetical protein